MMNDELPPNLQIISHSLTLSAEKSDPAVRNNRPAGFVLCVCLERIFFMIDGRRHASRLSGPA